MKRPITAEDLRQTTEYFYTEEVPDLVYLPEQQPLLAIQESLRVLGDSQVRELLPPSWRENFEALPDYARLMLIEDHYRDAIEVDEGKKPAWAKGLPPPLARQLVCEHARTEDAYHFIYGLPHTGVSYFIREDGLVQRVIEICRLFRLAGIRQLAYLERPVVIGRNLSGYALPFHHTRYLHSLDVAAIANLLAYNCGLSLRDHRMLVIAALTHDAMTPAGGDSVKAIDPVGLCEERNYAFLVNDVGDELRKEFGVDPDELTAIVQGRYEPFSGLVDVVDKCAYIGRDFGVCVSCQGPAEPMIDYSGHEPLRQFVREYPNVCDVWDAVSLFNGNVVFSDPMRLARFLWLRVGMFRRLYCHPAARFRESFVVFKLTGYFYSKGELTRDILMRTDDAWLESFVREKTQTGYPFERLSRFVPCVETYRTPQELERRVAVLKTRGVASMHTENVGAFIKPATHFLVRTASGDCRPLREVHPVDDIEALAKPPYPFHLYFIGDVPGLSPEFATAFAGFS